MRVRVEHVFGRMAQMGADLCRSIGILRAANHNHLCNLTCNMNRYAYLPRQGRRRCKNSQFHRAAANKSSESWSDNTPISA